MLQVPVDDIPALIMDPSGAARGVALWLPYLGGNKEEMEAALVRLAEAGFAAASLDPWMHGTRALAGIDQRVRRVATIGSTPDWCRPGMRSLDGTGALIDQGTPSALGQWLYSSLDPITHADVTTTQIDPSCSSRARMITTFQQMACAGSRNWLERKWCSPRSPEDT